MNKKLMMVLFAGIMLGIGFGMILYAILVGNTSYISATFAFFAAGSILSIGANKMK